MSVRAFAVRSHVDIQLGGRSTDLADALRVDAIHDAAPAQSIVAARVPGRIHTDHQGAVASQNPINDDLRNHELRVEQDGGSLVPEVPHQVQLRGNEIRIGGIPGGPFDQLAHRGALVHCDDQDPAAWLTDLLVRA